jgi:hypothetical protein
MMASPASDKAGELATEAVFGKSQGCCASAGVYLMHGGRATLIHESAIRKAIGRRALPPFTNRSAIFAE